MRLLFPNGEHAAYDLKPGVTRIGSGAGCEIALIAPGIAAQHCEIDLRATGASVRVANPQHLVLVNGRQVAKMAAIKPGDLVLFAKVGARVVAVERAAAPVAAAQRKAEQEEDGRTRVRMALPKFILRGVSGSTFGKTFPLFGSMTVGRSTECDICIPGDEVSRQHARLQVMPDGVAIEDLGSANGTFIAGKRVHQGMLKAGEELRLDTVRFLLVSPSLEGQAAQTKPATPVAPKPPAEPSTKTGLWVGIAVVLVAGAAAAAWAFGLLG
jgi:pSer/pThr/pTyr-binding forkhead associated (FHA) protein